jgi:hypothetical protein
VRTCSHDAVAQAAVASLGPEFLSRVRNAAARRGLPPGKFVADSVRRFESVAGEQELCALQNAIRGADMPLLRGLALIVEVDLSDLDTHG